MEVRPKGLQSCHVMTAVNETVCVSDQSRHGGLSSASTGRRSPPPEALAWVVSACDVVSIESVEPMRGGSTLAMHRLRVVGRDGVIRGLVMRRYVQPEQLLDDPDIARHEAGVLQLVEAMPTPTPILVACDPDGARAGAPAVLMTELDGRPRWNGSTAWMRQLAEVLVEIHAVDTARATLPIRAFTKYQQASYEIPR